MCAHAVIERGLPVLLGLAFGSAFLDNSEIEKTVFLANILNVLLLNALLPNTWERVGCKSFVFACNVIPLR